MPLDLKMDPRKTQKRRPDRSLGLVRKDSNPLLVRANSSAHLNRKFSSAFLGGDVSQLVSCGFSEAIVRAALKAKAGDVEAALDECLRLQVGSFLPFLDLTIVGSKLRDRSQQMLQHLTFDCV